MEFILLLVHRDRDLHTNTLNVKSLEKVLKNPHCILQMLSYLKNHDMYRSENSYTVFYG